MITRFIPLFRAARLLCHLTYGLLLAIPYPMFKQPTRQAILKRWSNELLEILNVQLEITGHLPAATGKILSMIIIPHRD